MRMVLLFVLFAMQTLVAQNDPRPLSWGRKPAGFDPNGNRNDQAATLKKKWKFVYPKEALKNRIGGQATLYVAVDKKGKVQYAELSESSGHAQLDTAAVQAIHTAEFRPARLAGKPVASIITVPVKFHVEEAMAPSRPGKETYQLIWKDLDSIRLAPTDSAKKPDGM